MKHFPEKFDEGMRDGVADIASDRPMLFWQTRGSWGDLLTRLMYERFGVAVQHTSDITNAEEVSYRRGYNHAIEAYIDDRFGTGSYEAAMEEVHQYRVESYRKYSEQKRSSQA